MSPDTRREIARKGGLASHKHHGQGFASMSPSKRRRIAAKGGRASARSRGVRA